MEDQKKYYLRPLWFWNEKPNEEGLRELMRNCAEKDKYAGFGILPYDACKLEYMGEEYLKLYGVVLEEAKKLGLKLCLYDEWWFPSGWAGGILKNKYPEVLAKRLDMEEYTAESKKFCISLPKDGKIMAVVGMKGSERIDLEPQIKDGYLEWCAPEKNWIILCFVLRKSGWNHVDFLSAEAVKKFIKCTHEVYYKHFSEYFGNVIDSAFYDEPQFYGAEGRMWTETFNERFKQKYGESSAVYYPALFYDIGEETAFARNAMLSLRADLYAEAFPGTIQQWCTEHGISLTGHVDQEEVENPVGMTGDLIKSFRYQDMPGVDEIVSEGRASSAYKIISSAAVNWNKKLVMCECFGAMNDLTDEMMYRESYDLFTKGVNYFVPHAVWYDNRKEKIIFQPELSYRDEYFGKVLPGYSEYYARVASYLQNGRQVNDVAILYPIESLQYQYTMNWEGDPYQGGPTNEKNNYMRLGQFLIRELNCDFTFLHPEVVVQSGIVKNGVMSLAENIHDQNFKVIILPGIKVISVSVLKKLAEFVRSGGTLISVSELPVFASEKGESKEVGKMCEELFGVRQIGMRLHEKRHKNGGKCYCMSIYSKFKIKEILNGKQLDTKVVSSVKGLQYIHKRLENDVWYFASTMQDVVTDIVLQGDFQIKGISPKSGNESRIETENVDNFTKFSLSLKKGESLLIVTENLLKDRMLQNKLTFKN